MEQLRKACAAGMVLAATCSWVFQGRAEAADFSLLFPGSAPLETIEGSGFKFTEQYSVFRQVRRGSERLENPGARESHLETELAGFVSPAPWLTLVAVVPYRTGELNGVLVVEPDGSVRDYDTGSGGSADGLGDVTLLARLTALAPPTAADGLSLAVLGGVKLATGDTDARTNDGTEYLDSRIQPGSGSTDYVLGASLAYRLENVTISANLLGNLPGEGEAGEVTHRFGKALNYDLSGKYLVYRGELAAQEMRCCLLLGLNGEWRGRDRLDGATEEDSGGNTVYLAPGLQFALAAHWVLDLTYQRAVYHHLNGTQLVETQKIAGGLAYRF